MSSSFQCPECKATVYKGDGAAASGCPCCGYMANGKKAEPPPPPTRQPQWYGFPVPIYPWWSIPPYYHYPLEWTLNPYWQTVTIPASEPVWEVKIVGGETTTDTVRLVSTTLTTADVNVS